MTIVSLLLAGGALLALGGIAAPLRAQAPPPPPPAPAITMNPATLDGTAGFFRVGQSKTGQWYFVDPENRPFLFKGVTSVSRANAWGNVDKTQPRLYAPVVERKYGGDPAAFREGNIKRLRDWKFNALGAWSEDLFWDHGMPYTIILDFVKDGHELMNIGMPNVYDPGWAAVIDAKAKRLCTPHAESRDLIGYFTDNELGWPAPATIAQEQEVGVPSAPASPSLLQRCLSQPANTPEYGAAWAFVSARHPDAKTLPASWGIADASPDAITALTKAKHPIRTAGFVSDDTAFVRQTAERYFRLSAEAVRRYDKNHLLLGCRFGGPPDPAVFAAVRRPWVDVVSANNYRDTMYERMDIYYQATHLPVLNTEFAWASDYFVKPRSGEPTGGLPVSERMVVLGRQSLARALSHPALVGYTWFRWVDKPDQLPPASFGIVTADDAPNWAHLGTLTWINENAEAIHAGGTVAPIAAANTGAKN